jgi:isocitrate/isopropylmalate dehydrogenase
MQASLRVLDCLDLPIDWDYVPSGRDLAELCTAEREAFVHGQIDASDTVLFGATNGTTPGARYLRWGKLTFANVRPIQWRPGFRSPLREAEEIDYVIVRENLEDMYVGVMGEAKDLLKAGLADVRSRLPVGAEDGRFAAKIITRPGTEQVTRFACELALQRNAKLTVSAKTNMLPATDRWFCEIAREIAQDYAGLEYEEFIVDDMAHRLVIRPQDVDVLLLPNLYGDVLSDLGAGTIGGLGLAPSGCYGNEFAYFESAHGTAPDIAGMGIINPTATLLSAAMMLRYLDLNTAADRLNNAIGNVYLSGSVLTPDQGGDAGTENFADAVIGAL